jgi:hypothetical protein
MIRSLFVVALGLSALSLADEQPDQVATTLNSTSINGYVNTSVQWQSAAATEPQVVTGVWSTSQCRRGTNTPGGTFSIAVSPRRRLDGLFLNTSDGSTDKFKGRINRRGKVRGHLRPGRMVEGFATGTTNIEIHAVFRGKCIGSFDTVPVSGEGTAE